MDSPLSVAYGPGRRPAKQRMFEMGWVCFFFLQCFVWRSTSDKHERKKEKGGHPRLLCTRLLLVNSFLSGSSILLLFVFTSSFDA